MLTGVVDQIDDINDFLLANINQFSKDDLVNICLSTLSAIKAKELTLTNAIEKMSAQGYVSNESYGLLANSYVNSMNVFQTQSINAIGTIVQQKYQEIDAGFVVTDENSLPGNILS